MDDVTCECPLPLLIYVMKKVLLDRSWFTVDLLSIFRCKITPKYTYFLWETIYHIYGIIL